MSEKLSDEKLAEIARGAVPASGLDPSTVLSLVTELQSRRAAATTRADGIEVERLREALKAAQGELAEAADKFWVIHCNHPGKVCGRTQEEDKQFCATVSKRMTEASYAAIRVLSPPANEPAKDETEVRG